jgi:hypothetical protein
MSDLAQWGVIDRWSAPTGNIYDPSRRLRGLTNAPAGVLIAAGMTCTVALKSQL